MSANGQKQVIRHQRAALMQRKKRYKGLTPEQKNIFRLVEKS